MLMLKNSILNLKYVNWNTTYRGLRILLHQNTMLT